MTRRPPGLAASMATPSSILLLLLLVLLAALPALAFDPNFDFYPSDAQPCLYDAAEASQCEGDTAQELNACLCGNKGGFVQSVAQCLGRKDKKDVGKVYDTMSRACVTSKTPLNVKKKDFLSAASDAASEGDDSTSSSSASSTKTTTTKTSASTSATATASSTASTSASATASSTASPSASPDASDNHKPKLTTAGTIGVAAGVSIAGVAAIGALAFFLVRRRKRDATVDESFLMLPPEKYGGAGAGSPTTFPPHEPVTGLGVGAGFDHGGAKSQYSVSTFSSAQKQRQSYTPLPSASPEPSLHQQHQQPQASQASQAPQHNFLASWEPPTTSHSLNPRSSQQYVGPFAEPPQARPASNVFELDSHGEAAVSPPPPPPQPALQPSVQPQQPPREYRPYMPPE